jgi:hypothetical protein
MQQEQEQELAYLRNCVAELALALQEQRVSHKDWIRNNLEEAQQIIDNIVGIKGITEDPLKAAAELEAPYSSHHNYNHTHPPHEELYGY